MILTNFVKICTSNVYKRIVFLIFIIVGGITNEKLTIKNVIKIQKTTSNAYNTQNVPKYF